MEMFGLLIYVLLVWFLIMFWRKVHGLSFEDMLRRSAAEHTFVLSVTSRHPRGGTWGEHNRWMREEDEKTHR